MDESNVINVIKIKKYYIAIEKINYWYVEETENYYMQRQMDLFINVGDKDIKIKLYNEYDYEETVGKLLKLSSERLIEENDEDIKVKSNYFM